MQFSPIGNLVKKVILLRFGVGRKKWALSHMAEDYPREYF